MRFVNINPKWPDGMADKRVESVAPRGGGWGMINAAEIAFGFASNSYKGESLNVEAESGWHTEKNKYYGLQGLSAI